MKKTIFALAAAAVIAAGTLAAPQAAQAQRCYGCGIGLGVLGGLIIGSAIANSATPRYYAPPPGYVEYDDYRAPYPAACPGGYWSRRPIAFDAYGNPIRWSRPRFVCP
jgi:hypothetical protein